MTITLGTTNPLNQAIKVPENFLTSSFIEIELVSSNPPFNIALLSVDINEENTISGGVEVFGTRIYVNKIQESGSSIFLEFGPFSNPTDEFESFTNFVFSIFCTDQDGPTAITYLFRSIDTIAPVIEEFVPSDSSIDNETDTSIFFRISDQGSGIDLSTLNVSVDINNGATSEYAINNGVIDPNYTGSLTTNNHILDVFLSRIQPFDSSDLIKVGISVFDENKQTVGLYEFQIADIIPPTLSTFLPSVNAHNVPEDSTISFTINDNEGSGINLSTLNVQINQVDAIKNGSFQYSILAGSSQFVPTYLPSTTIVDQLIVVMKTIDDFSSNQMLEIFINVKDNKDNLLKYKYYFTVRDFLAPQIQNQYPTDGDQNILSSTDIRFSLVEDPDGYGIDFSSLSILVDGYSIINQSYSGIPIDGYYDEYMFRTFTDLQDYNFEDGYIYDTPAIQDLYPGFQTTINHSIPNQYDFKIDCLKDYQFNSDVSVKIDLSDRGGNSNNILYFFTIADKNTIITSAYPDTGTYKNFIDGYGLYDAYKFLYQTGIKLTTNLAGTTTFYTTDGSTPRIDSNQLVIGTTKVYTKPILINKQGITAIKFFSIDNAGNQELVKQEVYNIDILPPEIEQVRSVAIVSDINLSTTIIPVEETALFSNNQTVKILDDNRPPILTKILTINSTSNPQFIIVENPVRKLKVSRNARVEVTYQPIDKTQSIDFDTVQPPEYFYIGSDGLQTKQADSVFDQFRILNRASTDQEMLADFTLLEKGSKFYNQQEQIVLSSEFSDLEKIRVNMPDNTLVLLDFDGTVLNKDRQGILTNNTTSIVDTFAASNDIIFKIKVKKDQFVDRELLKSTLEKFAPVDLNIIVQFIEID